MSAPNTKLYLANLGAALIAALTVTLLALAWFDLLGYYQFLASLENS